jgi:hypothetical protein
MGDALEDIHLHHEAGEKEHDKDGYHGRDGIVERLQK